MKTVNAQGLQDLTTIAAALAEPHRVRALLILRQGERCVAELIELLGLSPASVSRHLSILHGAGLIEARRDGKWLCYRLPSGPNASGLKPLFQWLETMAAGDSNVRKDSARLQQIRKKGRAAFTAVYS
jgi:DNA-binding transcriptional ArsR family regulator